MAKTQALSSQNAKGSLAGVRVLDLSRVLGGPFCAQILGDHGADVIKIEPPQGDETRTWGPPFSEDDGVSAYFGGANRNKKCLAIDLTKPEGREVLFRLLEKTDVVVENFKPGTLEAWDLGFESVLSKKFPRLIHCRITGFGEIGPLGKMPGYDAAAQAWTGMMSINGDAESGPTRMGLPIIDLAAGLNACIGILAALYERERSGQGQSISTSLFESGLSLLHPHASNWFMSNETPKGTGSRHTNICPYDLFKTKTTPIFLAVGNNSQFEKLCSRIGCSELPKDPRFIDNKSRLKNAETLKAKLEECLVKFDGEGLAEELMRLGVPSGPVLSIPKSFSHPQAQALNSKIDLGGMSFVAPPLRLSRTPASVRARPEPFAASRVQVLKDARYSDSEIESLEKKNIVPSKIK